MARQGKVTPSVKVHPELHSAIRQRDSTKCRLLLEKGVDVNAVDGTGVSPLLVACEIGMLEIVTYLLEKNANVNFKKCNGTTALHIAAASGRLPVLEALIRSSPLQLPCISEDAVARHGAELDAVTSGSTTSLFVAAAGGHATLVKKLCQAGAAIEQRNHRGWTPLHAACQSGNPDAIRILLHYESDIESVTAGTCSTPLHIAAMNGNVEAVEVLIDVGRACTDARQADNFTPLMLACNGGILPLVQLLLRKGAAPDAVGANLRTAAHIAALGGHASVLTELLEHGADINAKSDSGSTPLLMATNGGHVKAVQVIVHREAVIYDSNTPKPSAVLVAVQRGHTEIVDIFIQHLGIQVILSKEPKPVLNTAAVLGHLPIVKLLLQAGADPCLCESERSMNALHEASMKGKLDVVRYLIGMGVEVDSATAAGETPLHLAAKSGHVDIAEYLIAQGAKVQQSRASGHTALHFAAARGEIPLARMLLDAGADIETCQSDVGTPLYISAEHGQVYVARFLLKRGADVNHACTSQLKTPLHAAAARGHLAVIEALLAAGANVNAKNSHLQRPEEIIGSRKSLSVVERGLIESTFSRHKKKRLKKGNKQELEPGPKKKDPPSPRGRKIMEAATPLVTRPEAASPIRVQCLEMVEPPCGADPVVEDDSGEEPEETSGQKTASSAASERTRPASIIDQITAKRAAEGFRLFNIKELLSQPSQDVVKVKDESRSQTARTPTKAAFHWNRLQRAPGSARADYRYSVTESPKKAPIARADSNRLSRSGSLSLCQIPARGSKSPKTARPSSSPSVRRPRGPLSAREATAESFSPAESRSYGMLKRFPRSKRSTSHDSGTQTEETRILSRRSGSLDAADSKDKGCLVRAAYHGNVGLVNRLLASSIDPNISSVERHGWNPLYAAARNGHTDIVIKLLQHGARVNETINSGGTALHGACAAGHVHIVHVLLKYGAKLDQTTNNGELPLHTAARNGYMDVVSLLLEADKSVIDQKRSDDKSTALVLAVEKGWAGVVKELIDGGADPGIAKKDGITPLYMAAIHGWKNIAQMILNSRIPFNVNLQTSENWTPLHVACARGDLELVRLLLRSGADTSLKTNMDMTSADVICEWVTADGGRTQRIRDIIQRPPTETSYMLVEAAAQGNTQRVKELLDDGADLDVFGDEGLTPLLYAVRNAHIPTVYCLVLRQARINLSSCPGSISALHYATLGESPLLVEFLLKNGADVRAQDETGQTPLHYASHSGFTAAVAVLIANQADVHANDKHGKTPLYMAAASNSYEAAALLLRSQAYPSCAAADGNTPLHVAAQYGGVETVQLLTSSRCDPNARNAKKETPLFLAAKHGFSNVVQHLMEQDITLDTQDADGNSPLHVACMAGRREVIETLLLSPTINLRLKNKKGLQCNEVVGELVGDGFERRHREHIVFLLLNRLRDRKDRLPSSAETGGSHSFSQIESFKCPITKQIMQTPVVASDGHTYELTAITEWMQERRTSPITELKFSNTTLRHNHKLRAKIEAWKSSNGRNPH